MLALADGDTAEALYEAFSLRFSHAIQSMCGEAGPIDAPSSALDLAILACAYSAGCAAVLKYEANQVQPD